MSPHVHDDSLYAKGTDSITGESLHPERSHTAPGLFSSVESSPAVGVHAPCDPQPCPPPTHWLHTLKVNLPAGLYPDP